MSTKMLVTARLDQRLTMSQQLKQAIALLQYNTLELQQLVTQYLETNPLLEIEETENNSDLVDNEGNAFEFPAYTAELIKRSSVSLDDSKLENYAEPKNLRDYLREQTLLCHFEPEDQILAENIIDAIDDDGFLTMSPQEIFKSLNNTYKEEKIIAILEVIKTFDPPGVGAANLREALLIQLDNLSLKDNIWELARKIVSECLEVLEISNAKKILSKLKVNHDEYIAAVALIGTLNMHPGTAHKIDENTLMEPELYVKKIKGKWKVFLTNGLFTQIKINKQYQQIIKQHKKDDSYAAMKQALEEAQWLTAGLKRRNDTLLQVAAHIMQFQENFLDHGHEQMKPLNILDVANVLGLHESTVSRVTTGKYIATPRGVYELKYFFPSHVSTRTGGNCSATAVKAFIKEIISHEQDHAYSDNEIADLLQQKGINIARRTITKYRESMNILASYQRDMHKKITEKA